MTFVLTYDSLRSTIQSYVNRTDDAFTDQIDNFIELSSNRIMFDRKVLEQEFYLDGTFTIGESSFPKPQGWLRTVAFNVGTGTGLNTFNPILLRSYEYVRNYTPDDTETGVPVYYADFSQDYFKVTPAPDAEYPFQLSCFIKPPPLSSSNQTNILTIRLPHLLQDECLKAAYMWTRESEQYQIWMQQALQDKEAINTQDLGRKSDRSNNIQSD